MAAITKIEFWSDVGFVDGAVEIPRLEAAGPVNPDVTIEEEILPSKDRFFSELKLKEYYTGLLTMSYMRITYDLKNSMGIDTPNVFYGWVDSVKLSSDGELPMTVISWHIDEWRTWKNAVTFGSGHIKRRPFRDLDSTPIQNYSIRYEKLSPNYLSESLKIYDPYVNSSNVEIWWVIFSWNYTDGGDYSVIGYATFPIFRGNYGPVFFKRSSSGQTVYNGISFSGVLSGHFDEYFSISPEAINGVWLSPVCPINDTISGDGTNDNPLYFSQLRSVVFPDASSANAFWISSGSVEYTKSLSVQRMSSEEKKFIIPDLDGFKSLDIPYGMVFDTVTVTLVVEPTQCYIVVSVRDGLLGRLEGCSCVIPLPLFPINTNALSEYVYSGQRDYEKEMRTLNSNASAVKNTVSGAGTGALIGAFGPVGAAVGGVVGGSAGLISYGTEMLYQNDMEQELQDRLKANQTPSLIMGDAVCITMMYSKGLIIIPIVPDDYSSQQIIATRNQFGISVDELMSSCDSLIRYTSPTGYYNIQNMIVNGNVPVSAKKWIREKFRSGVRLK